MVQCSKVGMLQSYWELKSPQLKRAPLVSGGMVLHYKFGPLHQLLVELLKMWKLYCKALDRC